MAILCERLQTEPFQQMPYDHTSRTGKVGELSVFYWIFRGEKGRIEWEPDQAPRASTHP